MGVGCVMEVGMGVDEKKIYNILQRILRLRYFFVSFMIFLRSKGCINYYFNQIFWRQRPTAF